VSAEETSAGSTGSPLRFTERRKKALVAACGDIFGSVIAEMLSELLDKHPTYRGCDLCEHYMHGRCSKNSMAVIPEEFVPVGCEDFDDEVVPF